MNKYHVSNSEGKFAAGSGDDVLENKLQLSETNDINDAELVLLEKLYKIVFSTAFPAGKITVPLIKQWHRQWLGNIYDWAGKSGLLISAKITSSSRLQAELRGCFHNSKKNF